MLDELRNLLDSEALYQERIQKLETELSAFKRAYANVDGERQELQALNEEAGKQVKWLQNQLKVSPVYETCGKVSIAF